MVGVDAPDGEEARGRVGGDAAGGDHRVDEAEPLPGLLVGRHDEAVRVEVDVEEHVLREPLLAHDVARHGDGRELGEGLEVAGPVPAQDDGHGSLRRVGRSPLENATACGTPARQPRVTIWAA